VYRERLPIDQTGLGADFGRAAMQQVHSDPMPKGRTGATLCIFACLVVGCALTPERLPELDRRFYYNLDDPNDQQRFLEIAESERQTFLEQQGLWQKWAALPADEREKAAHGQVEVGFHEFALFMAYGPPADTQSRETNGRAAIMHTFIRCSSGPKRGRYVRNNLDCDGTSDETQVSIAKGVVVEIKYPN
jgi:hypothetical protein